MSVAEALAPVSLSLAPVPVARIREEFLVRGKAEFFGGLVLGEQKSMAGRGPLTMLDIGCGGGFHHRADVQTLLGQGASRFIGVEPDPEASLQPIFEKVFQSGFEQAAIADNSVDLAYAVMVLEHVADPEAFFGKLARILKPGGVFWGFTVDSRHWFAWLSDWFQKLGLKGAYLNRLHGHRGLDRYENFPTHYRCNTPSAVQRLAGQQFQADTWSLHRPGQLDFYFPKALAPISRQVDKATIGLGLPGSILVMRLQRHQP